MTFEVLKLEMARLSEVKAKFTIGGGKRSIRLKTTLTISGELAGEAGLGDKSRVNVLIGRGDSAGKLRFVKANDDGQVLCRQLQRSTSLMLRLGHVAEFANRRVKALPAEARVVETGTVEIDVPDFAAAPEVEVTDDEAESDAEDEEEAADVDAEDSAPAEEPAVQSPPRVPAKNAATSSERTLLNGIAVVVTRNAESVEFKGKVIEVTDVQAHMVSLLAAPRPQAVAESFLAQKMFPSKAADLGIQNVRSVAQHLRGPLRRIGLDLNPVKGVGFQLKDVGT